MVPLGCTLDNQDKRRESTDTTAKISSATRLSRALWQTLPALLRGWRARRLSRRRVRRLEGMGRVSFSLRPAPAGYQGRLLRAGRPGPVLSSRAGTCRRRTACHERAGGRLCPRHPGGETLAARPATPCRVPATRRGPLSCCLLAQPAPSALGHRSEATPLEKLSDTQSGLHVPWPFSKRVTCWATSVVDWTASLEPAPVGRGLSYLSLYPRLHVTGAQETFIRREEKVASYGVIILLF